jgi:hypothetical protein
VGYVNPLRRIPVSRPERSPPSGLPPRQSRDAVGPPSEERTERNESTGRNDGIERNERTEHGDGSRKGGMSEALRKRLGAKVSDRGVEPGGEGDPPVERRVVATLEDTKVEKSGTRRSSVWARLGLETKGGAESVGREAPLEGDQVERLDALREVEGQDLGTELVKEDLRTVEGQDLGLALDEEFGTETGAQRSAVVARIGTGKELGENGSSDPAGHGRKLVTYDDISPKREESPKARVIMPKAQKLARIGSSSLDDQSLSPPSSLSGGE